MAKRIRIRRGLKADIPVLDVGEQGFCTDTGEIFIGTAEGNVLTNEKAQTSFIGNIDTSEFNLVLAGIDSLTNGAGGSSYLDYFAPRLRGELGDGGAGYVPFDNTYAVENGFGFGKSGGLGYIENAPVGQNPSRYSFDLKGLFTDAGQEEWFTYQITRKWKRGKLFYLKQPSGGTFNVGFLNNNLTAINTADTGFSLGVYEFDENDASKDGHIVCGNINGKVAIFGGLFYNDEGVAVSRIGRGGRAVADMASVDSTVFAQWLDELQPKLFIFNGGMNDRGTLSASAYATQVGAYLTAFKPAGSHLMLVESNDVEGDNSRLKEYGKFLRAFAKENNGDFISDMEILGSYSNAVAGGLMFDGIHPNSLANRKRANHLLTHYSIPLFGINKTEMNGTGGGEAVFVRETILTPKSVSVASGSSAVIYRLGLNNGYPNGVLRLEIAGSRNGTTHGVIKETLVSIGNWTVNNAMQSFDGQVDRIIYQYATVGQPLPDHTVSFAIVNGFLEVSVAPNTETFNMDFSITGKVTLLYVSVAGQSVYENPIE